MGDCKSIPCELVDLIFEGLGNNLVDSLNFGAVSKEWRDVVVDKKRNIIPRTMIMMLEDGKDDFNTHGFYGLSSSANNWEVSLLEYRGKKCVGSNNGWLIMVDEDVTCQVFLLNPLAKSTIFLPILPPLQESWNDLVNKKRAFSFDFTSPTNFMVAICFQGWLYLYKAGDEKWVVHKNLVCPDSVVCYKEKLYVKTANGQTEAFNLNSYSNPVYTILPKADESPSNTYLVESKEKGVLMVVRKEAVRERSFAQDTWGFEVYMLDEATDHPHWVEVDDLGEEVLFLGLNAICLPAQSVPECKANSIYFTDNTNEKSWSNMGVFDMEDQSIKPLYQDCPFAPAPSIWFTPNLQSKRRRTVSD